MTGEGREGFGGSCDSSYRGGVISKGREGFDRSGHGGG